MSPRSGLRTRKRRGCLGGGALAETSLAYTGGWAFLGPRSSRTLLASKGKTKESKSKKEKKAVGSEQQQLASGGGRNRKGVPCCSKNDSGDAETSKDGMDDEVLSAVDKLMKGEKGEKLNKALEDVIALKAAK